MGENRHFADQILLSLFLRESAYNTPIPLWDYSTACQMTDLDDQTVHELYDDSLYGMELVRDGGSGPTAQRLIAQSVRMAYTESRAKLNTLAGLLGLTLGQVATQELTGLGFGLDVFVHTLTPAPPGLLPSISAVTRHQQNVQTLYPGIKSEQFRLSGQSAFLQVQADLIGSGSRVGINLPLVTGAARLVYYGEVGQEAPFYTTDGEAVTFAPVGSIYPLQTVGGQPVRWTTLVDETDAPAITVVVPAIVQEPWMLWGDSTVYFGNALTGPVTLPLHPVQGQSSLNGALDILDVSARVISCEIVYANGLAEGHGYRDMSGLVRGNFHASQSQATVMVTLYVDLATEAEEITRYALQTPMAFEWQWWSPFGSVTEIITVPLTAGTPPEYHIVTDELGGTWYLYPVPPQALEISETPPAGTGLVTGTGAVALSGDRYRYRLGVTSTQQLTVARVSGPHGGEPHAVEYYTLRDSNGTPWHIWFTEAPPDEEAGTYAVSETPPAPVAVTPGMALVLPKIQWRAITRGQTGQLDTLTFVGTALLDGVNALTQAWVITRQPAYLAGITDVTPPPPVPPPTDLLLIGEPGHSVLLGHPAVLTPSSFGVDAAGVSFIVAGQEVTFGVDTTGLLAEPGVFVLSGQAADLHQNGLTLGTPPEYHIVTDELGGVWYLYPVPTGALEITRPTPPAGTGLVVGTGHVALFSDRYRYRLGVTSTQQLTVARVSGPHLDEPIELQYFTIRDSDAVAWHIWFTEPPAGEDAGTYQMDTTPPGG